MRLSSKKRWIRLCGAGVAVVAMVAAGTISGSCALNSKTTLCEQFDLRCKEGQECAAKEAVCIPIGGCGNSRLDPGEMCDDGNVTSGDGCSSNCKSDETCGNGIIDDKAATHEECDDGRNNGMPDDNCDTTCHLRSRTCGNGMVDLDVGEQCDPGVNFADTKDCNSRLAGDVGCRVPRCGDGYTNTEAGEGCDTFGLQTTGCNGIPCTVPTCGDHIQNGMAGEECDNGSSDTFGCNGNHGSSTTNCKFPHCGDGYTNMAAGEECDSADGSDTSTCNGKGAGTASCKFVACGDGYINVKAGEQCETSDGHDSAVCNGKDAGTASCKLPVCGDGHTNMTAGEICDDGNHSDNDSCPDDHGTCHNAICGDHFIWNTDGGHEECDDGNDSEHGNSDTRPDACRTNCMNHFCGDGVKDSDEMCDKKNNSGCQGVKHCDSTCSTCI